MCGQMKKNQNASSLFLTHSLRVGKYATGHAAHVAYAEFFHTEYLTLICTKGHDTPAIRAARSPYIKAAGVFRSAFHFSPCRFNNRQHKDQIP
ncbi:hypothetical protein ApDm4_2585 [Acetobacter pomorum]|nr:hypothetical protein ApDm4_2585 [Acetobacter pomorum]